MPNQSLTLTVDGDASGALAALSQLAQALGDVLGISANVGTALAQAGANAGGALSQVADDAKEAGEELDKAGKKGGAAVAKLSEQIAAAGKSLKDLGGDIQTAGGELSAIGGKLLGFAGMVGGVVNNAAKAGVDMNLTLQASEMALQKITGSASSASKLMGEMRKEALTSKMELKEMLPLGTQLAAVYGPGGIGKVMPTLRAFGDAAALLAANDKGAAERALGQFRQLATRQTPAQGDITNIETNLPGIGISKILKDTFGTADVDVLAKAGKTGMDIAEAIVAGIRRGPLNGAQQELAKTVPVLFSNIGDAVNEVTGQLTGSLMPQLAGSLEAVVKGIQGLAQDKDALAALSVPFEAIGNAIKFVADGVAGLVQWFRGLAPEQQKLLVQSAALVTGLAAVGGVILTVVGGLTAFAGTVVAAIGSLMTFGPTVAAAFSGVAAAVGTVLGPILAIIAAVVAAVTFLVVAWQRDWGGLRTFVQAFARDVARFLGDLWNQVVEGVRGVTDELVKTFRAWWPYLKPAVDFLVEGLSAAWELIKGVVLVAWEAIKLSITTVLTVLTTDLKAGLALLRGDWKGALDAMKEGWDQFWGSLAGVAKKGLDGVRNVAHPTGGTGLPPGNEMDQRAASEEYVSQMLRDAADKKGRPLTKAEWNAIVNKATTFAIPDHAPALPDANKPPPPSPHPVIVDVEAQEKRRKLQDRLALEAMSEDTIEARKRKKIEEARQKRLADEKEVNDRLPGKANEEERTRALRQIQQAHTTKLKEIDAKADQERLQAQTSAQQARFQALSDALAKYEEQEKRRVAKAGASADGIARTGLEARARMLQGFTSGLSEASVGREGLARFGGMLTDTQLQLGPAKLKAFLSGMEGALKSEQRARLANGEDPDKVASWMAEMRAGFLRSNFESEMRPGRRTLDPASLSELLGQVAEAEEAWRQRQAAKTRGEIEASKYRAGSRGGNVEQELEKQQRLLNNLLANAKTEAERRQIQTEIRDAEEAVRQGKISKIRGRIDASRLQAGTPGSDVKQELGKQEELLADLLGLTKTEGERLRILTEIRDVRKELAALAAKERHDSEAAAEKAAEAERRLEEAKRKVALTTAENAGPEALRNEIATQQDGLGLELEGLELVVPAGETEAQRGERERRAAARRQEIADLDSKKLALDRKDEDTAKRTREDGIKAAERAYELQYAAAKSREQEVGLIDARLTALKTEQGTLKQSADDLKRSQEIDAERLKLQERRKKLLDGEQEIQEEIRRVGLSAAAREREELRERFAKSYSQGKRWYAELDTTDREVVDRLVNQLLAAQRSSTLRQRWRTFWRDLGQQAADTLKDTLSGALEDALMGEFDPKKLLTDLKRLAAHSLVTAIMTPASHAIGQGFKNLFGGRGDKKEEKDTAEAVYQREIAGDFSGPPGQKGGKSGQAAAKEGQGGGAGPATPIYQQAASVATAISGIVGVFNQGKSKLLTVITSVISLLGAIPMGGGGGSVLSSLFKGLFGHDSPTNDSKARSLGFNAVFGASQPQVGRWGFDFGTAFREGARDALQNRSQPAAMRPEPRGDRSVTVHATQHIYGGVHSQVDLDRTYEDLGWVVQRRLRTG